MLKKSLPTNGSKRNLARVIVLADGAELVTLRDAANVLLEGQAGSSNNQTCWEKTMKVYLTVATSMAVGIAVGGFAVQGLQAQGKRPCIW